MNSFAARTIRHFIAGAGLVMVHGLIGRSATPHWLFAVVNLGVSLWAIGFYAITPHFMATMGVNAVFLAAAIVIAIAVGAAVMAFPSSPPAVVKVTKAAAPAGILALCFAGVVMLQTSQAMTFSFVERIGDFRQFGADRVAAMLVAASFVPLLAGLLLNGLPAINVAIGGLMFHGLLSATVSNSAGFLAYGIAASLMIATVVFSHTFVLGLLARLDPSGRTNAGTPSMLMIGTAIGPFVGGAVIDLIGYQAVGVVAFVAALIGAGCFLHSKTAAWHWHGGGRLMLVLYGEPMSRAHRVMNMLRELGVGFTHIPTDFLRGGNKTPDFLAVNPNGKLPVLVHDVVTMFASFAINLSLSRAFPSPLSAQNLAEEAGILQWSFRAVNEVEKTVLITAKNASLFAAENRRADEAQIGLAKLARPFKVLEAHLARREDLVAGRYTVADLTMAAMMSLIPIAGIDISPYPHVARWPGACLDRLCADDWKTIRFTIPRPPADAAYLQSLM